MHDTLHVLVPQLVSRYSEALAACAEMRALRQEIDGTADVEQRTYLQAQYMGISARWREAYQGFFATFRTMEQRARPEDDPGEPQSATKNTGQEEPAPQGALLNTGG